MVLKNIFTDARNLGISCGLLSIISVLLPWYSASASAMGFTSSISGNFMGATMNSGVGYGIYIVLIGGTMVITGGLLK